MVCQAWINDLGGNKHRLPMLRGKLFFLPQALWIAEPSCNPVHCPHSEQCHRRRRGDRQRWFMEQLTGTSFFGTFL